MQKLLIISNPLGRYRAFSLLQPTKMGSLSNSRWKNCKESPNRSTNNGDMVDKFKLDMRK